MFLYPLLSEGRTQANLKQSLSLFPLLLIIFLLHAVRIRCCPRYHVSLLSLSQWPHTACVSPADVYCVPAEACVPAFRILLSCTSGGKRFFGLFFEGFLLFFFFFGLTVGHAGSYPDQGSDSAGSPKGRDVVEHFYMY